ncbi:MAG TPA: ABC transporter substrate-binding protein [Gaiella sp.]|jgi:ABC-type oligopeptide transport system substrate-binding subunit|nr:ABC transporter substrate-binding protein [Gaiella sp.]
MHRTRSVGIALAISSLALLLVTASTAATSAKRGGTIVLDMTTDVDYIDPQLSYYGETWKLEATTACKLMNWPDKEGSAGAVATPEVAQGLPLVSKDGKTYTFTIRKGFRFSNGKPVTAQSFADAINRFANPKMQSTGVQFLDIIKGAQAAVDGKAGSVSGVKARGNKLVIQLTKASPDLLARVAMPFYQAIDPTLAKQIDANGINQYASCGPYYFASRTPGRSITLKRNPYYKGGRAANADTIQVNIGNDVAVEFQNVEKGTSDYASGGIPATEWKNVVSKYGLNKKDGRVQVRPQLDVRYVAMNHSRPLFKDNPQLAKAVNWAVDRQAFSAQGGYLYGKRTGQILPPGMLGYKPQGIYPLKVTANTIKQARKLAEGNLRGGKAVLWSSNAGTAPLQAQLIQYNLKQIGIDAEIKLLPRAQQFTNAGNPQTATFDMTVERWGADYADPYDFVNILLDGSQVTQPQHNNYAYFNVAKYNKEMTAASLLQGSKRGVAYAALDGNMMRNNPPWAPLVNSNDRIFLSARVGCVTINEISSTGPLLNVLCLK